MPRLPILAVMAMAFWNFGSVVAEGQADPPANGRSQAPGNTHTIEATRHNAVEDMVRRARSGDRDAMKWIIREHLARIVEGPLPFGNFWGIPSGVDQVPLMIEIVSERSGTGEEFESRGFGMGWLAQSKDPRAAEALSKIACDPSETIKWRGSAMASLTLFPEVAEPILLKLASDPNPFIRVKVLFACEYFESRVAGQILDQLSRDEDRIVRASATGGLQYWREHFPALASGGEPSHGEGPANAIGPESPTIRPDDPAMGGHVQPANSASPSFHAGPEDGADSPEVPVSRHQDQTPSWRDSIAAIASLIAVTAAVVLVHRARRLR